MAGGKGKGKGMAHVTRVCVIEDDADIRAVVRLLLEDDGYEVMEAADGLTGHALLRNSAERLVVVLDHHLPRMDGCDLLEIVATDTILRERHAFVFLTGSPQRAADDCGETLEDLAVPLLPKPFNIDQLLDAVAAAERRLVPVADVAPERPERAE